MKPFSEDFFSTNKPIWNLCDENKSNEVSKLFSNFFEHLEQSTKIIKQVGGIEINSNNYCIETESEKFLLKKWNESLSIKTINEISMLINLINSNKILVSKQIPSHQNEYVIKHNNRLWSLFQFDDGDFFSGTIQELITSAKSIGNLFNTLNNIDKKTLNLHGPKICSNNDYLLFKSFFSDSKVNLNSFNDLDKKLLITNKDLIQAEVEHIFNSSFELGIEQYSHFDIHPHNILVKNGTLSTFLDVDSIRIMNSGYALSFASLKLCKQTVIKTKMPPKEVAKIWLDELSINLNQNINWIPNVGDLAISEVLRRIAIILRLNIENNNSQWNNFLKVQLSHLKEARILFN